ncbi:MAG: DUF3089 domain-containing protein, partial [Caulobacteraceae bacterium]
AAGPGASAALPAGAFATAKHPKVDVFYIHPTTDLSSTQWNQDVADAKENRWSDVSVVARQAGVFSGCCRVFAPRYRQATHLALSHYAGDGQKALALAYADVERAFDYYIAHENHGRPFILAAHSQGGLHLSKLLERRIEGTPPQKRLVAVYGIGFYLSEGEFPGRYKTIPICETPAQTGCFVQWNSVLPTADLKKTATPMEQRYVDLYGDSPKKQMVCVNPLTFDRQKPAATAAESKGAVPGDPGEGPMQPLRAHAVSAHCEHGFLVVDPAPGMGMKTLPDGTTMHYHDYGLFYEDLRENAVLRSNAFLKAHPDAQ